MKSSLEPSVNTLDCYHVANYVFFHNNNLTHPSSSLSSQRACRPPRLSLLPPASACRPRAPLLFCPHVRQLMIFPQPRPQQSYVTCQSRNSFYTKCHHEHHGTLSISWTNGFPFGLYDYLVLVREPTHKSQSSNQDSHGV